MKIEAAKGNGEVVKIGAVVKIDAGDNANVEMGVHESLWLHTKHGMINVFVGHEANTVTFFGKNEVANKTVHAVGAKVKGAKK